MNAEQILQRLSTEEIKTASIAKRAIAMTIDDFLISMLIVIAFIGEFSQAKTYEQVLLLTDRLFVYIFVVYTLYHWIFITLYGKTVGKMVVKIRVLDIYTLDYPGWKNSFLRSVMRNFDEMFFYLGMLYAFADPLNRSIHDIVGKCVVVED